MSQWLVVYTRMHSETCAETHLRRQGCNVYLPRYAKTRRHARRVERVIRPLFPRYLFVAYEPTVTQWRFIKGTVGVSQILLEGTTPLIARQEIIDAIQTRENEDGLVQLTDRSRLQPGQKVQIDSGPLNEQMALFEGIDDRDRAIVLIELLGRQVKANIHIEALTTFN